MKNVMEKAVKRWFSVAGLNFELVCPPEACFSVSDAFRPFMVDAKDVRPVFSLEIAPSATFPSDITSSDITPSGTASSDVTPSEINSFETVTHEKACTFKLPDDARLLLQDSNDVGETKVYISEVIDSERYDDFAEPSAPTVQRAPGECADSVEPSAPDECVDSAEPSVPTGQGAFGESSGYVEPMVYAKPAEPNGSYFVEIRYEGYTHMMQVDSDFRKGRGWLNSDAPTASVVLSSMLRIMFAQACPAYGALSLHASCVVCEEKGYLFMGESGMGKSTHSRLWMKAFPGCWLLNDDNPVLRLEEAELFVYGTPWSGKTPCYKNMRIPVGGIVRLRQAAFNLLTMKKDVEAFVEVYKGCSALRTDASLHGKLCDVLLEMIDMAPVGTLQCLPDEDAARVCRKGLDMRSTEALA